MELKTFPKYMYHRDHDEPVRVDSKAEQTDMTNKGWVISYLHKEYPKWIGDKLVRSRAEEDRLQGPSKMSEENVSPSEDVLLFKSEDPELPHVIKETQIGGVDLTVTEKPEKPSGRSKKK